MVLCERSAICFINIRLKDKMKEKNNHVNVIFPEQEVVGERDWGEERLVALIPEILSLKVMTIKSGKKGGLQYHHKKNECGYVVSGEMLIRFDAGDGILKEKIIFTGDSFHFPPGSVHQEEALTDCIIVEASTPYFNDRVRVESEYGLPKEGGLPSVKESEVILK